MTKHSITKHNKLIQASYRLTLNEVRILQYGISLINPKSNEFPLEYEINVQNFIDLFKLEDNKNIYAEIKDTVMGKFREREFTFDFGEGKKEWFRWLIRVTYVDHEGYIKIYLNPYLKPFLHQLQGQFTSYNIDKIALFKSVYSSRIYEIALMNLNASKKNKYSFSVKISQFKEQLDIVEKYKKSTDFNKRVLEPSKKEINKHSDIHISYKVIKKGRRYHEIIFTVTRKKEQLKRIENKSEPSLSPAIIEKAKYMIIDAGSILDVQEIVKQFFEFSDKNGAPQDIERAFIGFVNHKIQKVA